MDTDKRPAERTSVKRAPTKTPATKTPAKKATAAKKRIIRREVIDIRVAVRQWLLADDAVTNFSTQKELHRKMILDHLEKEGEPDDSGSQWLRFHDDPVEGRVKAIKREKRVKRVLDRDTAEQWLRDKGLWQQCVETIEVLDETKLLALNWPDPTTGEPVISDEELGDLYDVITQWAFVPQRVKL